MQNPPTGRCSGRWERRGSDESGRDALLRVRRRMEARVSVAQERDPPK